MERTVQVKQTGALAEVDSTFKYTAGGNVQAIWRKHGWVPPTEYRNDYLFKSNRDGESDGLR